MVELLKDQDLSTRIGEAAKQKVRQMFLLPQLALAYLKVVRGHVGGGLPATSGDRTTLT